jgi:hypothetical protein
MPSWLTRTGAAPVQLRYPVWRTASDAPVEVTACARGRPSDMSAQCHRNRRPRSTQNGSRVPCARAAGDATQIPSAGGKTGAESRVAYCRVVNAIWQDRVTRSPDFLACTAKTALIAACTLGLEPDSPSRPDQGTTPCRSRAGSADYAWLTRPGTARICPRSASRSSVSPLSKRGVIAETPTTDP